MTRRSVVGPLAMASVLAVAFFGCNSILDNQPGTLGEAIEAGLLPGPTKLPKESQDSGSDAPTACNVGEQMCFGTCVSLTDPLYGCGDPSCTPCSSNHGTMSCQGRKCVVSSCDKGYDDCNGNAADGCETDLSKATSCGACNAVCGAAARLCTPSGPSFQCTNGCTPAAPLDCGTVCVDPATSPNHCGGCNTVCPAVANGTATCTAGLCTFACKALFHACAGVCVASTDPLTCGPTCAPCPVPTGGTATCVADVCGSSCKAPLHLCPGACVGANDPLGCGAACTVCAVPANATATCTGNTCGFTCTAGFGNCDANAVNGCEATFASDPLNCGKCGKACTALQTCLAGACVP